MDFLRLEKEERYFEPNWLSFSSQKELICLYDSKFCTLNDRVFPSGQNLNVVSCVLYVVYTISVVFFL